MLKKADFDPLIEQYMICEDGMTIMEKNEHGDFVDVSQKIFQALLSKGAVYDDPWQMLKLYFYFEYFIRPSRDHSNQSTVARDTSVDLTFNRISGINRKVHKSSFWVLPRFSGNRKLYNDIVLRKGSDTLWAKGAEYVKQSNINEDINPEYGIYRPTHLFAKGSPTAKYNWILGRFPLEGDNEGMIRFYFNVKSENFALPRLLQNIQKIFDLYEIPFKLKFLGNEKAYQRADPVVLYVERKYPFVIFFLIKSIYDTSSDLLRDELPMFVQKLGEGLGFAEDPVNSDSFGMFACELLTDALLFARGVVDDELRGSLVEQYIVERRHLNIDQIYQTGSLYYDYRELFKIFSDSPTTIQSQYRPVYIRPIDEADFFSEPGVKRTRFLFAAVRIALRLCKEAFWSPPKNDDHANMSWECNWFSFKKENGESLTNYLEEIGTDKSIIRKINNGMSLTACYSSCSRKEKNLIAAFLRIISRFYNSDIITKTMALSNSEAEFVYDSKFSYRWADNKLNQAWKVLFDIEPEVDDKSDEENKVSNDEIGDYLIKKYLIAGRPIGNCFASVNSEQNVYFCPTLTHGLAGVGYFFLYLYDPSIQLPFKLNEAR